MPVPKRRNAETPEQRQIADRVRRARAADPPRDPLGIHFAALSALAQEHGFDLADMLDEFDERAAVRQYDAGVTRTEAERLAEEDVRERYLRRQGRLL